MNTNVGVGIGISKYRISVRYFGPKTSQHCYNKITDLSGFQLYFIKKVKEPVPKEAPVKNYIIYGDVSYSPIDQLSAFIDEVC